MSFLVERTNFATCLRIGELDQTPEWHGPCPSPGDSGQEKKQWHEDRFNSTVRQHCMVRTMPFCVCCQERAEACLHLHESHALAKDAT